MYTEKEVNQQDKESGITLELTICSITPRVQLPENLYNISI